MLIDTSVFVAIHNKEEGFQDLLLSIASAKRRWCSVASYLEFVMVTKNPGWMDDLTSKLDIDLIVVSKRDIDEAVKGFLAYGKGFHRAALNFGDCIVYGTAKATAKSLLYKGNDFSKTDLIPL